MRGSGRHDAGAAHEQRLAAEGRRAGLGAWYTPAEVVDGLLGLALDPLLDRRAAEGPEAVEALRVLDPSCGSGHFLLAAAQRVARCLVGLGLTQTDARVRSVRCLVGVDIDPDAVGLARVALDGFAGVPSTARLAIADALAMAPPQWGRELGSSGAGTGSGTGPAWADLLGAPDVEAGYDLVVGNPPFLGQLREATRQERASAASARRRFGDVVGAFTDPAALFWALAAELARADGGVVAMVLPVSLLATRDAESVRRRLLAGAEVRDLWVAQEPLFASSVDVCAPVLVRQPAAEPVDAGSPIPAAASQGERRFGRSRLWWGKSFHQGPDAPAPAPDAPTWSGLLATLAGLAERELASAGRLGDIASGKADFRDQYYGLVGHVVDQAEGAQDGSEPVLVTVGSVDPAHLRWGERATRFQRTAYLHPRVRVTELDERMQSWATERLVPKVLVATQTRVLEAVVDREGGVLPSVPILSLVPRSTDPSDLDRIAAVLTSPPITLLAARRHLGTARQSGALKLRVAEVLALPLPADRERWDAGAAAFRAASDRTSPGDRRRLLLACGQAMTEAYGLGQDLELRRWWEDRLPRRR